MLIINRPHTDPYFNLATEEFLLKNTNLDCFMLWQNEPSIIVGKHQNTLAEINYQYVKEKKIPVIRRISGGGTVFHDLGNLNFTFIRKGDRGKLVDFRKYTKPIIDVLNKLDVPAKFEGKNDLRVNGLKISGNAEHVYKNKVIHHGTLLFKSDLGFLNNAIKASPQRYKDKAVQSVRSTVTNISDHLKEPMSVENFKEIIINHVASIYEEISFYSLSDKDISMITQLVKEKYNTWNWNFGYSPKYTLEISIKINKKKIDLHIDVEKGIIQNISTPFEIPDGNNVLAVFRMLQGKPHDNKTLESVFRDNYGILLENHIKSEELLDTMF